MDKDKKHTILLGGIGGDSHSVGLSILRQALSSNGFRVVYIGIQNQIEEFMRLAPFCNAVLISNMDGHAKKYLEKFVELNRCLSSHNVLWYLGGNVSVGDDIGLEKYFLECGFKRVFVKYVDVEEVLSFLSRDLHSFKPIETNEELWNKLLSKSVYLSSVVSDDLFAFETFNKTRKQVLDHWKTGYEARCIESNAAFLKQQPLFSKIQADVNSGRLSILLQPRSGVALVDEQIKLFKAFQSVGINVLSYQVDSMTRNNNYVAAEEAIRNSKLLQQSTINGFPVINHGVSELRRIISEVKVPLQTRHSTRDPRLLAEISYAGGVSAFEGGPICYNMPYYRDYLLSESIPTWQYVDRLTGYYYEKYGIIIDREFFGPLTGTLIPPSLAIVTNILESVLAITQGVKCISLGYAEQGNRIQDIAAMRALGRMASDIIHNNLGYKDVQINTVFHQYMAAFPPLPEQTENLIFESAKTAKMSGATRVMIKSPVEAYKIPSMADNIYGLSLSMRGIRTAQANDIGEKDIEKECKIIQQEADAIIDKVLFCGQGCLAEGIVKGFERGIVDIPFSPSIHNRGEVMTARDAQGAVRYLVFGNLPFTKEIKEFNRFKMNERKRMEGLKSDKQNYLLVEQDVLQIARGQYESWPLYPKSDSLNLLKSCKVIELLRNDCQDS